jgi:hypothetical protein
MMASTRCPHQTAAARLCNGCDDPGPQDNTTGLHWCGGDVEAKLVLDSDGDGVWSTPVWLTEDEDTTCGCTLTEAEWDAARTGLLEAGRND